MVVQVVEDRMVTWFAFYVPSGPKCLLWAEFTLSYTAQYKHVENMIFRYVGNK